MQGEKTYQMQDCTSFQLGTAAKVRCSQLNAGSFVRAGTKIFREEVCEWMLVCSKEEKFM